MAESPVDTIFGFNKSNVVVAASLAGAAFVGYCIYFDSKRRSDPEYKNKIRQKRREATRSRAGKSASGGGSVSFNPTDPQSLQAAFLQEVQLGEELFSSGNIEQGAAHMANAVALCGDSQHLLQILQQTMPPEHFNSILRKLPDARDRLAPLFPHFGGDRVQEVSDNENASVSFLGDGPSPAQELIDDTDDLE
ncbi:unnamed protein product [Auanema sp. JU1783]|nr:unnamed protein product [Auanema sp. JU1783]